MQLGELQVCGDDQASFFISISDDLEQEPGAGGIGVVGVFLPVDPGGVDENAKDGKIAIDYGLQCLQGQSIGSGQCPVKKYNRQLRELISVGKAKPSWIVSHEIPLSGAADAYKHFGARNDGWTKVILKP